MKMVVSLTGDVTALKKVIKLLVEYNYIETLFSSVLITPLFASKLELKTIKDLKINYGSEVYFDSGGYYVQQGKIGFNDLYTNLSEFYSQSENHWADWYILPDNPPVSKDNIQIIEKKVKDTITASRLIYDNAQNAIKNKCMPVIHGYNLDQINLCLKYYDEFNYLGFGSFSTTGTNECINQVDPHSLQIIAKLMDYLAKKNKNLHIFGVSTPPIVYAFHLLGVKSFDSSAWLRSAGYGKVFLPFMRAYNVTHLSMRNGSLTQEEFEHLKTRTGHSCPFCDNFYKLQKDRIFRASHNLMAMRDTLEFASNKNPEEIADIIYMKSNKYYKMLRSVMG